MKKGLGLQANISGFNTTLPQTKHLNFFMGTNPVGYANGGAVRRGVPSSNMNVTQGFLPMALGFDNGGDVSLYTLITRVIGNYLAKQSGKSPEDPEIIAAAENLQQTNPDAVRVIMESEYGSGVSAGAYDSGFPIGGEPKLPTETVADDFSSAADATKNIKSGPDSTKLDGFPFDETVGVTTPSTLGETDTESSPFLDYLQDKGKGAIDAITGYFEDDPIRQTGGDASVMEEIMKAREDAPQVKEDDVKKPEETSVEETPVDVKSATVTDGGIADLNKEEQKELQETIKGATDNKDKKDAPSWALPLMSAGFAMMASKSPNFLQALGEAGQEGIKTLAAQKEAEQDRLDRESERDYKKVMGDYYKSGGSSGNKPITSYQGKLYTASGDPFMVNVPDGEGGFNKVHAPAKLSYEEALALAPKYYGTQWDLMDGNQKEQAVLALMRDYDTNVNATTSTAAGESNDTVKEGLVINTVQFLKGLFS
jgi:uncharacterized protein (UPF0297 family)